MFLQSIKLENIRSIEHLELFFNAESDQTRRWTLLLGENGTGKSSVLRSIALVTAGSAALSELLLKPDSWIRLGAKECRIHAELVTADGEKREISLGWGRGQNIREVFDQNAPTLDRLDAALKHSMRNYFTVGYGASRRLGNAKFSTQNFDVFQQKRARNVATLFSNDAVMNPLDVWAMDLEYRKSRQGFEIVKQTISEILPEVKISRIDREKRELLFETADGELPLEQLSDGYQNMAGWCGDLLYRITETYGDYKHPLKARGLLLIDELDLHLHPIWQRILKDFLVEKMPNFQIIATTHSPLTAQEAGEKELYFLRRHRDTNAAELEQYAGAPNKLFTHQMLLTPAFGLETVNSKKVEEMRREFRNLSDQPESELKPKDKRRLRDLETELSEIPDWTRETELDRKQFALLEKIETALGSNGAKNADTKRKK
jgi:predicted ATP-binding protein involved in virulence